MNNAKLNRKPLHIQPLSGFPMIYPGDSITQIILKKLKENSICLEDNDILVIAQKIISKSENRLVRLSDVKPGEVAKELAEETEKSPELVELILSESKSIIRKRPGLIIAEHKNGFICANAGIDHSNVKMTNSDEKWVLLLPEDADQSARNIQQEVYDLTGKQTGVLITDSHGRAWRLGTVGISIGTALIPELVSKVGDPDLFGHTLKSTLIAAADQLAAGATLMMGEAAEGTPVVHVRGFPYPLAPSELREGIRSIDKDLFR